jgi:hypothetical protein
MWAQEEDVRPACPKNQAGVVQGTCRQLVTRRDAMMTDAFNAPAKQATGRSDDDAAINSPHATISRSSPTHAGQHWSGRF